MACMTEDAELCLPPVDQLSRHIPEIQPQRQWRCRARNQEHAAKNARKPRPPREAAARDAVSLMFKASGYPQVQVLLSQDDARIQDIGAPYEEGVAERRTLCLQRMRAKHSRAQVLDASRRKIEKRTIRKRGNIERASSIRETQKLRTPGANGRSAPGLRVCM